MDTVASSLAKGIRKNKKNHAQHGGCLVFAGLELRDHRRYPRHQKVTDNTICREAYMEVNAKVDYFAHLGILFPYPEDRKLLSLHYESL